MNEAVTIAISLAVLVFSVIVHEVAHGYVAHRLGDPTARIANRLTLNPIEHIDLMGSIVLPLILVLTRSPVMLAWAKPVPVDPRYFRRPRRDGVLVSVAGVAANLALATLAGLALRIPLSQEDAGLRLFLALMLRINVALAVFNLVPIPPLDGSHVVAAALPAGWAQRYMGLAPFGFIIIYLLLYWGGLGHLIYAVSRVFVILVVGGA